MQKHRRNWFRRKLSKRHLAKKLTYSPFLRLLLFKFWFRLAFIAFVLLSFGLGMMFPKIWRTSPPGFSQDIKVSLLDKLQAWSLKRSARKAMEAGHIDQATHAWQAAYANNRGDGDSSRGMLQHLLKNDANNSQLRMALGHSIWLLMLTATNQNDLALTCQVFEKYRLYDLAFQVLTNKANQLPPNLEPTYLKTLFNNGQMEQFSQRWEKVGNRFAADPELRLYWVAYRAGWGPPENMEEAQKQLVAAQENPTWRLLANRLNLAISYRLGSIETYGQSLTRLSEWRAATALDHIQYWRMLTSAGRKAEAVQLAKSYYYPPSSPGETIRLADAFTDLGLTDSANQFMQQYADQFGGAEGVWISYANLLMENRNWDELRRVANHIRNKSVLREHLQGFGYYLEGRAELGLDRRPLAEVAFKRVAEFEFNNKLLALFIARDLLLNSFPAAANALLTKLKPAFANEPTYWELVFRANCELRQTESLAEIARQWYQLSPNDPLAMSNYAAALLVLREQPEATVELTLRLYNNFPHLLSAKLNHSLALARNRRVEEAQAILHTIQPDALSSSEANTYYLVQYEIYLSSQQWHRARQVVTQIKPELLFPNQRQWLEQSRKQLAEKPVIPS